MTRSIRSLSCWLVLIAGCGEGSSQTPDATTTASTDAGGNDAGTTIPTDGDPDTVPQTLTHMAGPWMLPAGGEQTSKCESWTLNNEVPLYVNTVEMTATAGMHHSNWFFVPDRAYPGPDGTWDCSSRHFDQGLASYLGGVFFAQSTQVTHDTQQFPPGAVIVIPPHARVIGQLHMLNASPTPLSVSLQLTARSLARSAVTTRMSPFYLEYQPLHIEARGRSQFDVECPIDDRAMALTGMPVAMRFFYGLAHYHALGSSMRVTIHGGPQDGRALYMTDARLGESWATTMAPPVSIAGAHSLQLTCVFDNPRGSVVGYGNGDQEMCIWFGFTDSPFQWAGRATPDAGPMIQTNVRDNVTYHTAPCDMLVTEATHDIRM